MIREHKKIKKEDYAFYAPLAHGDLTDHVSGSSLVIAFGGLCTWDNNEDAYLFDATQVNSDYCTPFSWQNLNIFSNVSLSAGSYEYQIDWDAKYVVCNFISGKGESRLVPSFGYVQTISNYQYLNVIGYSWFTGVNAYVWNHYKMVAQNGTRSLYCNDTLIYSASATKSGNKNAWINYLSIYMIYYWLQNMGGSGYFKNITVTLL